MASHFGQRTFFPAAESFTRKRWPFSHCISIVMVSGHLDLLGRRRARHELGNRNERAEWAVLEEVVSELEGEPIELHIDRRDETLCKKILSDLHLNCGIVTDITTAGGLEAATNDGRFVVFNTIESRFGRAKVLLKPEIFAILYGGQGGM